MAYNKPYTFRAGTYAKAAELNANFDTLKNFVDELLTTFQEKITALQAYNKAQTNGDSREVFKAAQGSEENDVVINSQLNTVVSRINTLEYNTNNLIPPPTYNTSTVIPNDSVIATDGWLYITTPVNTYGSVTLGTQDIYLYRSLVIPVKSGTQVSNATNIAQMYLLT